MLDIHARALDSIDEGYHNFLLRYRASSKVVYGFVEGKDDPVFYASIVERFIPDDWQFNLLICGNKKKTIGTYNSFDWGRFPVKRIVFFVDRDTDEFVKSTRIENINIYYTDGYSIENSIVNRSVFYRLLSEAYSVVDADDAEKHSILSDFDRDLSYFKAALIPLMAQIIYWRLNGITAYLNECDVSQLFQFEDGALRIRGAYADNDALVAKYAEMVGATVADTDERRRLEDVFVTAEKEPSLVRGKFLLWFLAASLNYTHSVIVGKVGAYERPPRPRHQLGPKTVGFAAAPRARIPASLRSFIDETLLEFIGAPRPLLQ